MFFESIGVPEERLALVECPCFFNFEFSDQDCASGIVVLFGVENRWSLMSLTELRRVDICLDFMIVLSI